MDRERLLDRITVNPEVLAGKPAIRGMRISVEQILDALVNGVSERENLEDYPMLEPDDIRAVLLYALAGDLDHEYHERARRTRNAFRDFRVLRRLQ